MLLIFFPQIKIFKDVFLLPPQKVTLKQSSPVSVWGREVCVSMTERGRTEQDGKRSTESWDKNKIEFGDKCNFPITSVLFITNLKPSCTPGESSAYPQHRGEERKNKREWRAGKERKEEEKIRFWEGQLLTWPGTGLGGVALQQGWDGAHRLQEQGPFAAKSTPNTAPPTPINTRHWGSWCAACYLQ